MGRKYEALDSGDPDRNNLHDWGFYTQALWGFRPGWVAGLRLEHADASGGDTAADPFRDSRWRVSPNLTWHPTEFSKVRLQYNRDWAEHLTDKSADTVWLQLEYSLGSHFAHTF
jgi:outer membrane receptor protein involved in Fe transport